MTEDRKRDGFVLSCSIRDNVDLATLPQVSRWRFLNRRRQDAQVQAKIEELKLRPAKIPQFASHTITDPDHLRQELHRIRSQGYALDDHEFSDNMRCIAVPIFWNGGQVHSGISISGPDSSFTLAKLAELQEPMLKASRELSQQLGGLPWIP